MFDSYEFTNGNNRVFQLNYLSTEEYGSTIFPDTNVVKELTLVMELGPLWLWV